MIPSSRKALCLYLNELVERFNQRAFIADDPISVPHLFAKQQDIEIAAFWTAILSWGQRKTIIAKSKALFERMDWAPHDFIVHHQPVDRRAFTDFKHRTFLADDTLYFLAFFQTYYREHESLEWAFRQGEDGDMANHLCAFHDLFFDLPHLRRTRKHVATPARGSACKRINMFLRWMVRSDDNGVDFGLWKRIEPSDLIMPLDVHVFRVAQKLGLIHGRQADWKTAVALTEALKRCDPLDPVKYDYALFGLGVLGKNV